MALIPVTGGDIATIVTTLEMLERPRPRPMSPSPFRIARWTAPTPDKYRTLFRRVGEPWLWFSRLVMDDTRLSAIIHDPAVEIYAAVDRSGIEIGMIELDFRTATMCELSFFGLVPQLAGQGHGRWLMAEAMMRAWLPGITRVWVHTCTLDHPSALGFYRASGFTPCKRMIETFPDPRLTGYLAHEAAPHIPVLDGPVLNGSVPDRTR